MIKVISFNVRIWTRDLDSASIKYWKHRMEKMKQMLIDYNPDVILFQELMFPVNFYIPKGYKRVGLSIQHPIYIKKNLKYKKHKIKIHLDSSLININNKWIKFINVHSHWNRNILIKNCNQIEKQFFYNMIIGGDFNNSYVDIPLRLSHVELNENTFINFNRPTESYGIIDHFYYHGDLKLIKSEVVKQYGRISDHYPIYCEFV